MSADWPGIMIARCNPPTIGHFRCIDEMIKEKGIDNSLLILGSVDTSPYGTETDRNLFSFKERHDLIKKVYPSLKITGIPDLNDNTAWLFLLSTIVKTAFPESTDCMVYAGSIDDVLYLSEEPYDLHIVSRSILPVSATDVRHMLWTGKDISEAVDPMIKDDILAKFKSYKIKVKEEDEINF